MNEMLHIIDLWWPKVMSHPEMEKVAEQSKKEENLEDYYEFMRKGK